MYVATLSYSDVTAGDQEQEEGTEAVISCTVTGLTKELDEVKWTKADDSEITSGGTDNFVIDSADTSAGFYGDTQITTLIVPGSETDQDKTYKCLVISEEHDEPNKSTPVNLKVFSK